MSKPDKAARMLARHVELVRNPVECPPRFLHKSGKYTYTKPGRAKPIRRRA